MSPTVKGGAPRFDLGFLAHDLRIFHPWVAELPVELLRAGGLPAELESTVGEQPLIRVAKLEGQVVGAYLTVAEAMSRHRLVALSVSVVQQGRGIGSWMVGHALGVSESRGAREFVVRAGTPADGIFERLRFTRANDQWRMAIDPE